MNTKGIKYFIRWSGLLLLVAIHPLIGQEVTVISPKGTLEQVTSNSFTVSSTQPETAVEADIWYDETQSPNVLRIYEASDEWKTLNLQYYLGYNTLHHNTAASLQISSTHVNRDIHLEAAGDLSMNASEVTDADVFWITNTTNNDRSIDFSGFAGVFLRQGWAPTNLVNGTFPTTSASVNIAANSRYLIHITLNGLFTFANITRSAPEQPKGDISDLTDFTFKTSVTEDDTGTLAYNTHTTTGPGLVYWNGERWATVGTSHLVENERIVEDTDNGFIYVSLTQNGQWKVIRYNISDVNDEAETGQTSNTGITSQPTTLAEFRGLSF